jgi:hypothetical protein
MARPGYLAHFEPCLRTHECNTILLAITDLVCVMANNLTTPWTLLRPFLEVHYPFRQEQPECSVSRANRARSQHSSDAVPENGVIKSPERRTPRFRYRLRS